MDIIPQLLKAIPIVDEANKKILSDLLVKQFQEAADYREAPMTKEERDLQELLNYTGEVTDEAKKEE